MASSPPTSRNHIGSRRRDLVGAMPSGTLSGSAMSHAATAKETSGQHIGACYRPSTPRTPEPDTNARAGGEDGPWMPFRA
jgi:hypothetical protein